MAGIRHALEVAAFAFHAGGARAACGDSQWGYTAAMGKGELQISRYGEDAPQLIKHGGDFTWAVQLPEGRLGLCDEERHKLSIFDPESDKENKIVAEVDLLDGCTPVGAIYLEEKIWVACYGLKDGTPEASGLAVVDPKEGKLEDTYLFPEVDGRRHFVHNVYAFTINGATEIYVAGFGDPWDAEKYQPGKGIVRFDRESKTYDLNTTSSNLNCRSIAQQDDKVFYVLEQNPGPLSTTLVRLEHNGGVFEVTATANLPARDAWSDGGADVFLGPEPNTVFVTDRRPFFSEAGDGLGGLYYYTFDSPDHPGQFHKEREFPTGKYPRYTAALPNGDIVSCNKNEDTLTFFEGLAKQVPAGEVKTSTQDTVKKPSFFLQVCVDKPPTPAPAPAKPTPEPAVPAWAWYLLMPVSVAIVAGLLMCVYGRPGSQEATPSLLEMS